MADIKKFFDLHIEIGQTDTGLFFAKTVLGGSILFREEGLSPGSAGASLLAVMEKSNMWSTIAQNPALSSFPFPGPQTTPAIDPNAPKKMPSDLTSVSHPGCQVQCTSFDHFGAKKCKSMCASRSGI